MTTRSQLETIIDDRVSSWVGIPCALMRDNEPARTRELDEWMRLTISDGLSFIQDSAGLQDVTGSHAAHPFVLSFDIFTPINTGRVRSAEIGQAVSDYWAYWVIGNVHLDSATFQRIGEIENAYQTAVIIDAVRYERLAAR